MGGDIISTTGVLLDKEGEDSAKYFQKLGDFIKGGLKKVSLLKGALWTLIRGPLEKFCGRPYKEES